MASYAAPLELFVRYGQTAAVFEDADGQEHVVVLPAGIPADEARLVAAEKLAAWKQEGRAVYTEPLTFKHVV